MRNSRDRQIEDGMGFAGLLGENCRDCVSYQKELARKNRRIAELEAERDALKAFKTAVVGWREHDHPEGFHRATAEYVANLGIHEELGVSEQ